MHERFIDDIRLRVPDPSVILARGSGITTRGTPWSDIDFDVLIDDGEESWPWWLHREAGGDFRHISLAVMSIATWEAGLDEPQDWALGFAVAAPIHVVWARDDSLMRHFTMSTIRHPAGPAELEDLIESLGKARAGAAAADPLRFWPAIHDVGRFAPGVLRAFNPPKTVATRREALAAALAMPIVPAGWPAVLSTCLGLDRDRRPFDIQTVLLSTTALVYGIIDLASSQPFATLQTAFLPWEIDALSSGDLMRYLRQGE